MPPGYAAVDPNEPSASQTECLAECSGDARVEILLRFLHVQQRLVQEAAGTAGAAGAAQWRDVPALNVDGTEFTRFTEAAEREERADLAVASLDGAGAELPFHIDAGETAEDLTDARGAVAGRLIHRWDALDGVLRVQAERVAGPYQALRLRVRVGNRTEPGGTQGPQGPLATREDGLRYALVAAHTLIGIPGGSFISMTDHPEWAAAAVAACTNVGTWPVLAGPADCRDLVLSSPVILYDHPQIAPESTGDLFDATEIDEILTLRTMALTDEEKREARATDPRAAGLIDRLDGLPPEMLERLHGAIRYLEPSAGPVSRGPAGPAGGPPPAGPAGGPPPMTASTPALRAGPVPGAQGPLAGPFPGAAAADDVPVFADAVRALVESGRRQLGVAGDRPCAHRGSQDRPWQQGPDAARRAAGGRPGPVPYRPGGACGSGPARRGRAGARGGEPGRRSRRRTAANPRTIPLLRPRRTRADRRAAAGRRP